MVRPVTCSTLSSIVGRAGRHLDGMVTLEVFVGDGRADNGQGEMVPVEILGCCQKEGFLQGK